MAVARHKTALGRADLSRPLATAMADGLVHSSTSVFDYGCGRGDDLRQLAGLGIPCNGWDPVHRPAAHRTAATVVNLGYVLNVIENPTERVDVLRDAWHLTERVLVVGVRMSWDNRGLSGRPFRDGLLTTSGTFQKFYELDELMEWATAVTGTAPVVAAPGVFYFFRHAEAVQEWLAKRATSHRIRLRVTAERLYEQHQDLFDPLSEFLSGHGRTPRRGELSSEAETALIEAFGSIGKAFTLLRKVSPEDHWEHLAALRRRDLLVYTAMSRFSGRPRFSELPVSLARDIRVHFRSYETACREADRLLMALGRTDVILMAARGSLAGKRTPSALYVHRSALQELPPVLRVYEGCAQVLVGHIPEANLIKLSTEGAAVSYLSYPDFDRVGHPTLHSSWRVDLVGQRIAYRDYSGYSNPPVLHRKEDFVDSSYPRTALFQRLTTQEEQAGLFDDPSSIGTQEGWSVALANAGYSIRGHRLVRNPSITPTV